MSAHRSHDLISSVPTGLFIGGEWRRSAGTFAVENPANGQTLTHVANASIQDGTAALDAACAAAPSWAATDPRERSTILSRAFEMLVERADDFALLMTLEMGKPLAESRAEVTYGAEFLRWFAEEAVRIRGMYAVAPSGGSRLMTMKQPVGPVLAITPWNLPLAMATRKIAPALAAGCTIVLKPAAQTPLTALAFAALLAEAGLPDGVLNVIPTTRAGEVCELLIRDDRLRKLTFTGSTDVGRRLIQQSAERVLKVSMELGGNAPFIVFDDADVDAAIAGAMVAKMRHNGEACTAANRFIVHESVAKEFGRGLAAHMRALKVGDGTEEGVDVGPLVDERAVKKVALLVADAVEKGAKVTAGGLRPRGVGHYYPPTVLADVPRDASIMHSEIFGPVAPITTFRHEQDAIALANNTEYGLVSYFYTRDLSRAMRVAEALESGMVGVNQGIVSNPAAPFGGVKTSGLGREGGSEGLDEFLETKYVGIKF
ncbi:NAD-dependent succinate-semialdehyde dehydrogenase [Microbacterium sp. 22303]|uniref:NAD-dependent succinate-semialdehyde dehydrogenase n=1 Tax=Microbacterium sp. 22303 TaxID=3453905 RepID=UPI003F85047A